RLLIVQTKIELILWNIGNLFTAGIKVLVGGWQLRFLHQPLSLVSCPVIGTGEVHGEVATHQILRIKLYTTSQYLGGVAPSGNGSQRIIRILTTPGSLVVSHFGAIQVGVK